MATLGTKYSNEDRTEMGEERGGQQERTKGQEGQQKRKLGKEDGPIKEFSSSLKTTLCTLPGLSRCLGCVFVSSLPAQGPSGLAQELPFPWVT